MSEANETNESSTASTSGASAGAVASNNTTVVNNNHIHVTVAAPKGPARKGPSASRPVHRPAPKGNTSGGVNASVNGEILNPSIGITPASGTAYGIFPKDIDVEIVNGNYVTTVTDHKHGSLVIKHNKATGEAAITMTDPTVQLRTHTAKAGFEGYRNEPSEYGTVKREFAARQGDPEAWFDSKKPRFFCADTSGWDHKAITNPAVNVATAAEIRTFMAAHPALAAFVNNPRNVARSMDIPIPADLFRSGAQDLTLKDGRSVNLDEIKGSLNPNKKLEVCPANSEQFMTIKPLNTGTPAANRLSNAVRAAKS